MYVLKASLALEILSYMEFPAQVLRLDFRGSFTAVSGLRSSPKREFGEGARAPIPNSGWKSNLVLTTGSDPVSTECSEISTTTVFVDTRLLETKHPRKRFQNFRQSYVLLTDRIEIHQSQPLA